MTSQAALAAQPPAANGAASAVAAATPSAAAAVKKEASPAPPEAAALAAASRGGTPAADGAASGSKQGTPAPDAAAAAAGSGGGAAPDADAPPSKEDEEQRALEDEIVAEGKAIAGVRALLAKAFSRPAEEPAVPQGHWSFLLREAQWLANDMAQERLWKQAAAMAVAYEVAKLKGKFGLRPPPEGQRTYHDEIAARRATAAKDAGEGKGGGRRGAAKAAATDATAAAALKLDPAEDPIFRDLESGELELPATPPTDDLLASLALTFQHDAEFQEALAESLARSDIERMMREEMAAREYRFEYEAALASHHMAVQEQNRRAMRLDADMADAEGLVPMDDDGGDDDEYGRKKAKARKRPRAGYLLDDFASVGAADDETESVGGGGGVPRQRAASRQYIEDTYLQRKRRRERYKDVDADYDVGMEMAGRYGTRANRAIATRAGASRAQDPNKRKQLGAEGGAYVGGGGQGAMGRHGAPRAGAQPGAVAGPVIWSKQEDDVLLAITHEFGTNWTMVSEVLSLSLSMQGIFRPPHLCKQRFRHITTPLLQQQAAAAAPPGTEVGPVDYSEEKALYALFAAMTKLQARELIVIALPVHDDIMMRMLEALVQVGATAKQRRQLEEKRAEVRKVTEPHPSHQQVHQAVMAKTGNKHLSPMELAVQVDVAYAQQAKQHAMLAQQAQQAAQLQAQQAAAPPPPGQQQGGGGGGAGGPSPPVQGMPAGGPGVAAGTPAGPSGLGGGQQQGMPSAPTPPLPGSLTPHVQQQQQQPGMPPPPGAGGPMPSPAGAPGHGPGPRPAQPQITLQQLNHILETGKLPNGQPLAPDMRKAIEDKKAAYLSQMAAMQQRQVAHQMAMQQQAGGGVIAGAPSAATQAALQAAQQAAAVTAGMRPAMPMPGGFRPGMPAMPGMGGMPGQAMPGQPMMQPGMPLPGMGMPGGMGMQGMQPGMQMSAAAAQAQAQQHQQLIAQQFAMQTQQQAQMAAAAQAQPGQGGQGGV